MVGITSVFGGLSRAGRLAAAATLLAALSLGGCKGLNGDPSRFQFDPALEWGRTSKTHQRPNEFWGVSNEARQIEKSCGVQ